MKKYQNNNCIEGSIKNNQNYPCIVITFLKIDLFLFKIHLELVTLTNNIRGGKIHGDALCVDITITVHY